MYSRTPKEPGKFNKNPPKSCKCLKPNIIQKGRAGWGKGKIRIKCTKCEKWGQIDTTKKDAEAKIIKSKNVNIRKNPINLESGIVKRVLVTPDKHFPLEDRPALNCTKRIIELADADTYVDLGDTVEANAVSRWNKNFDKLPLDYKITEIDYEVGEATERWDDLDEALDKSSIKTKYFTMGNHDVRYDYFVADYKVLKDKYAFIPLFELDKRGYNVIPFGEMLKIGKLHFYHGHHSGGISHARTHLLRFGINVIYGHHHSIQHYELGHVEGTKSATSLGCLKDLSGEANEWLKNLKHGWGHAVATVDFYDDGNFSINVHRIVGGKTVFYGEYIDGNKAKDKWL